MSNFSQHVSLIWSIADLLRGSWKQYEYQDIILPFVVLRRLDCILENTKTEVLELHHKYTGQVGDLSPILEKASGYKFYNTSPFDFKKLLDDPSNIAVNLNKYILGFSEEVEDIFDKFKFQSHVSRLKKGNVLYEIIKKFESIDLHIDEVDNMGMGYIFEELIRKFSEQSNDTAGEHYTPRDVIQIMVDLMFIDQKDDIDQEGKVVKIYDPCSGTGGMLTEAKDHILHTINDKAKIHVYGQEINPITYAVCKADMLIKGEDINNIKGGQEEGEIASTLSNDQLKNHQFDYILSNPPYGVDWKKDKTVVSQEAARGFSGRFGAGTPRISDGQLLFLQHMISKMQPLSDGGGRVSVIMNGSPLFTGNAGSGESEIRRWVLESDYLEAIIALPDQLFYNTGINTYIWILSNNKEAQRKGKVQLIDARNFYKKMRKSLGNKRHEILEEHQKEVHKLYQSFENSEYCKIFKNTDFSYRQITIEQPTKKKIVFTKELADKIKETDYSKITDAKRIHCRELLIDVVCGLGYKNELTGGNAEYDEAKNNDECIAYMRIIAEPKDFSDFNEDVARDVLYLFFDTYGIDDEEGQIILDKKGKKKTNTKKRDTENVPYGVDVHEYFEKEVKPYLPDAWINKTSKYCDHKDGEIGKLGYEINFTRYFYTYTPPRALKDIESDIVQVEGDIQSLLTNLGIIGQ